MCLILDTVAIELVPPDRPLLRLPNANLTPHIAARRSASSPTQRVWSPMECGAVWQVGH